MRADLRILRTTTDGLVALHLLVRVCVAEAESWQLPSSRSPLYVRGGRLHAFEKLFSLLTPYIDKEDMT